MSVKIGEALSFAKDLTFIVQEIIDAVSSGKPERVEAILSAPLQLTLAKAAADLRAERKFFAHADRDTDPPPADYPGTEERK